MSDIREWWTTDGGFFGPAYRLADDSLGGPFSQAMGLDDRTALEVLGVEQICQLKPNSAILDCPTGYGRHARALDQRGHRVTGVDINHEFLDFDRRSSTTVNWVEGDMRTLPYEAMFDAVINMFYSFGFFEDEQDDARTLEGFRRALRPGGSFLMHTHVLPDRLLSGSLPAVHLRELPTGAFLRAERRYNEETRREDGSWSIVGTAEPTILTPYSVRLYDHLEWPQLCFDAGFNTVEMFGDWNGKPYEPGDEMLIVKAIA